MGISKEEAQEALEMIQSISNRTKTSIANGGANFLILWGIIWFLGFTFTQYIQGPIVGYIWMGLSGCGGVVSFFLGRRMDGQVKSPLGKVISRFWIAIFFFTIIAVILVFPRNDYRAFSMMIITMVMLGYTIMGLFTNPFISFVGIFVTLMGLFSYFIIPGYFGISMAFFGGGTLTLSGIYMQKKWKSR